MPKVLLMLKRKWKSLVNKSYQTNKKNIPKGETVAHRSFRNVLFHTN